MANLPTVEPSRVVVNGPSNVINPALDKTTVLPPESKVCIRVGVIPTIPPDND